MNYVTALQEKIRHESFLNNYDKVVIYLEKLISI